LIAHRVLSSKEEHRWPGAWTKSWATLGEIMSQLERGTGPGRRRGTSFADDLGIDPLRLIDVAVEAEVRFDVTVPDEEIDNLKTAGDFAGYVFDHLS
jgi:acyl carrier protein